jgi:hypothetical protein
VIAAVGVRLVVAAPLETLRRIVQVTDVVVSAAARIVVPRFVRQ